MPSCIWQPSLKLRGHSCQYKELLCVAQHDHNVSVAKSCRKKMRYSVLWIGTRVPDLLIIFLLKGLLMNPFVLFVMFLSSSFLSSPFPSSQKYPVWSVVEIICIKSGTIHKIHILHTLCNINPIYQGYKVINKTFPFPGENHLALKIWWSQLHSISLLHVSVCFVKTKDFLH